MPENVVPFQRVTNWRRPAIGSGELAERAAALLSAQATELGSTGLLLAAVPDDDPLPACPARALRAPGRARSASSPCSAAAPPTTRRACAAARSPADDPLRGTWTEVALGPGYGACFVARRDDDGDWRFATSYDHETVVECAVVLMARMPSLAAVA